MEPYVPEKFNKTHKAILQITLVDSGCYSDVGYPDTSQLQANSAEMALTYVFISTGCIVSSLKQNNTTLPNIHFIFSLVKLFMS